MPCEFRHGGLVSLRRVTAVVAAFADHEQAWRDSTTLCTLANVLVSSVDWFSSDSANNYDCQL